MMYVHKDSNHPPGILKNIPEGIKKRLSNISANEEIFQRAAPPYQEALNKSGYSYKLHFSPPPLVPDLPTKRNRKRNITWFNPPFSKNVKTNIGKKFFDILSLCFPPENPLSTIFNRNTVKLSFSCMPNISQVISRHNKQALRNSNWSASPEL